MVTRAPVLHGVTDLGSVERHDAGQHRGGVRQIVQVANCVVRGAGRGAPPRRGGLVGAGGQERRQPLRRAKDGVVDLRQLARHAELRGVRNEGEGESDADENDEREGARRMLLRLQVQMQGVSSEWQVHGMAAWHGFVWMGGGGGAPLCICTCEALCERPSGMSFT